MVEKGVVFTTKLWDYNSRMVKISNLFGPGLLLWVEKCACNLFKVLLNNIYPKLVNVKVINLHVVRVEMACG